MVVGLCTDKCAAGTAAMLWLVVDAAVRLQSRRLTQKPERICVGSVGGRHGDSGSNGERAAEHRGT